MKNRWFLALILSALGASGGCRVGYEEIKQLGFGDSAGEGAGGSAATPSGGSSGRAGGGTSGSSQGGSTQGGSSGGGTAGADGGEAGAPSGGTDSGGTTGAGTGGRATGGSATGGSGGRGGASGAGTGGTSAGSGGTTGGTGGSAGSTAGGGAGGASGAGAGSGGTGGAGGRGGMAGSSGSGGYGGSAGAPNGTLCNTGMFGGHTYLLCKEERNWWDANGGCVAAGMRLVRIDDAGENQWLYDNAFTEMGRNSAVWIGATDQLVEGEWRWSDGALFWLGGTAASGGTPQNGIFNAWYFREPNNVSGAEHCASLETNGSNPEWYDSRCENVGPFICESL